MSEWKKVTTVEVRLKEAMRLRNKKQVDLVNDTGIAKGTISNYINGKYEPKAPAIAKLAQALNCSEMWIMGFDVPMDRYAYVDKDDAEFLDSLPKLHQKQELPPELEAVNTLLGLSGKHIMMCNDEYFIDECGMLNDEEVNELLNNIVFSVRNAVDMLTAKKAKELKTYLTKNNK